MSEFAALLERDGRRGLLHPASPLTPYGGYEAITEVGYENVLTAWTANRAVYQPLCVTKPVTVTHALIQVVSQNGNVDAGIYSWDGTRVVSGGGGAMGAAGLQPIDFADTVLAPGWYRGAFSSDSASALIRVSVVAAASMRACGLQEQASAYPLPSSATFATYSTAVAPCVAFAYRAVT